MRDGRVRRRPEKFRGTSARPAGAAVRQPGIFPAPNPQSPIPSPQSLVPPSVYLTGFMGSGKSTVGPLVADLLGYKFVDLDWLVEAREGRTVADLFAEGEPAFRAAEARALAESTRRGGLVVATGGGTLLDAANLRRARAAGAVVWLRASPAVTLDRLADTSGRPLLTDATGAPLRGEALAARVRELLAVRAPVYARAGLAVDADGAPAAVARDVAETLRGKGEWRTET